MSEELDTSRATTDVDAASAVETSQDTGSSSSRRSSKKTERRSASGTGLTIERHFTSPDVDPFDTVEWELRSATIGNEKGETVFEQKDVEIPKSWSQLATNVVVSKYFRGHLGTPERERSVKQLIGRVVGKIREWGEQGGYFATEEDARAYADELTYLLVHQKMAFNSPVWFNLGVENTPQQASACFINSVEDTMESIMDLAKTEAMLFKGGSGTGSNLSTIRSSKEQLAGGGTASGPVSFMRGFDSFAGVVKSGGKTRRAAKMVILNVDHPDIMEFVASKADEEKKAWSLIEEGYEGGFNVPGGAYDSVFFQNANHSVRVNDDFMQAAEIQGGYQTKAVTTGEPLETLRADKVLREMADAAHICGDPGIQYDTTINRWNPVKNSGRINSSNPCSEYMFLDDTACNLASLNLMTFVSAEGRFEVEDYRRAAGLTILGQEIVVDYADYPTPQIERNSHLYRPLGLGYANLGALLMANGVAYDSDNGTEHGGSTDVAHVRRGLPDECRDRRGDGPVRSLQGEPQALPRSDRDASRRRLRRSAVGCAEGPAQGIACELGPGARDGHRARLQERSGDRPRADRHDRVHDGLRHDRRRAGHRAGQVQEARRWRLPEDREQHGADGAREARLLAGGDRRDRRLHR